MRSMFFATDIIFLIRSSSVSSAVSPSTPSNLTDSLLEYCSISSCWHRSSSSCLWSFLNRFSIIVTDFSIALLPTSVAAALTALTINAISRCIWACTSILSWVFTPKPLLPLVPCVRLFEPISLTVSCSCSVPESESESSFVFFLSPDLVALRKTDSCPFFPRLSESLGGKQWQQWTMVLVVM